MVNIPSNNYFDIKQISEAVSDFNIARKNVVIYPSEHAQVKASVDRALKSIHMVLGWLPELTITVVKETLLIGSENLSARNLGHQELALALKQHEIAAVGFHQGLQKEELLSFLNWISQAPEKEPPSENRKNASPNSRWPHIQTRLFDYSQLHISEEVEIRRDTDTDPKLDKASIWKDFVTHLVAGTLSKSEDADTLSLFTEMEPLELASLLNQNQIDTDGALRTYQKLLDIHAGNQTESNGYERISTGLPGINALLQKLNPELRRQFLSITFTHLSVHAASAYAATFVSGISPRLLREMVRQANRSGKEVSPALISLLRTIADIQDLDYSGPQETSNEISAEDLQTLFKRENYDEYVGSQYDTTLKQIASSAKLGITDANHAFPIAEYLPTLGEQYLNGQITRMLIAFIGEDIQADEYQVYTDKLMEISRLLLDEGDFELILKVFEILNQHSNYKRFPEIRAIAEKAIQQFREPMFTSKAVQSLHIHKNKASQAVFDFMVALGPQVVPDALNLYAGQGDHESNQTLFNLLSRFPEQTLTEAHKRLRDTRSDYIQKLVTLIREIGGKNAADILRPLWEHNDRAIQMEVLAALLKFKDKWGLLFLRRALKSNEPDISKQAIGLAEAYQVFEAADDLASMLKKRPVFKSSYNLNERLIRALGMIGNPSVLPVLKKMAGMTWSVYPQALADMKRVLFKSLGGYPPEAVRDLLYSGLTARDKGICKICQELLLRDVERQA